MLIRPHRHSCALCAAGPALVLACRTPKKRSPSYPLNSRFHCLQLTLGKLAHAIPMLSSHAWVAVPMSTSSPNTTFFKNPAAHLRIAQRPCYQTRGCACHFCRQHCTASSPRGRALAPASLPPPCTVAATPAPHNAPAFRAAHRRLRPVRRRRFHRFSAYGLPRVMQSVLLTPATPQSSLSSALRNTSFATPSPCAIRTSLSFWTPWRSTASVTQHCSLMPSTKTPFPPRSQAPQPPASQIMMTTMRTFTLPTIGYDSFVRFCDVATQSMIIALLFPDQHVIRLAFSRSGRAAADQPLYVVERGHPTTRVFAITNDNIFSKTFQLYTGHNEATTSVGFELRRFISVY